MRGKEFTDEQERWYAVKPNLPPFQPPGQPRRPKVKPTWAEPGSIKMRGRIRPPEDDLPLWRLSVLAWAVALFVLFLAGALLGATIVFLVGGML